METHSHANLKTVSAGPKLGERISPPLPIRYKKDHESAYWVNDVDKLSDETFTISMPIDLNVNDRIRFEIFNGGSRIAGDALVFWVGRGNTEAACRILRLDPGRRLI